MKKLLIALSLVFSLGFVSAQSFDTIKTNDYDTVWLNKCVKQTIYTIDLIGYLQKKNMLDKTLNTVSYINGKVFVNYQRVHVPKKLTKKLENFEMRNVKK